MGIASVKLGPTGRCPSRHPGAGVPCALPKGHEGWCRGADGVMALTWNSDAEVAGLLVAKPAASVPPAISAAVAAVLGGTPDAALDLERADMKAELERLRAENARLRELAAATQGRVDMLLAAGCAESPPPGGTPAINRESTHTADAERPDADRAVAAQQLPAAGNPAGPPSPALAGAEERTTGQPPAPSSSAPPPDGKRCSNADDHAIEDSGRMFGVHLLADQEPEMPDALFQLEEDAHAWIRALAADPEDGRGCDPQVIATNVSARWSNCTEHPEPPSGSDECAEPGRPA